jgi:hypothetical protein
MLVAAIDEVADLALEIDDRVEGAGTDCLVGDQREPSLDLIEPGAIGWREVQVKARPTRKPCPHLSVLMRAVVVADRASPFIAALLAFRGTPNRARQAQWRTHRGGIILTAGRKLT